MALPTTLPGTGSTLWSDGGVICITSPYTGVYANVLTSLPTNNYTYWINQGVFCITGDAATIASEYGIPSAANTTYPIWNDNGVLTVSSVYAGGAGPYTVETAWAAANTTIWGYFGVQANATVGVGTVTTTSVTAGTNATPGITSATATVNPLGNLYVNTGSLAQVSATGVARAFGNLYVNTAALAQANVNATANVVYLDKSK